MTDSGEYKDKYFEEKFRGVEKGFENIDRSLGEIKDLISMKASAGAVHRLEQRISNLEQAHIPCASVVLVQKEVSDMKDKFVMKSDFDKLKSDVDPIKIATESTVFFHKHPKLFKMVLIGAFVLLLISAIGLMPSWFMWKRWKADMRVIEAQRTEQPKTETQK